MAISLAAATLGAAVIGGGAAALGAKSNSKATKKAAATQADATAQQLAYQREADTTARGALSPFMERGNAAGDTINALLGLGGVSTTPQPVALPANTGQFAGGTFYGFEGMDGPMGTPFGFQPNWGMPQATAQTAPAPQKTPAQAAAEAYEIFKGSTGYQTRFAEGTRALNASFAGSRMSQSGAAVKSALRYGQEFASGEFGKYLGALGTQQDLGFRGAGALAGVALDSSDRFGRIAGDRADNAGALAVARANNNNNFYGTIAGIAGNAATNLGALSSYRTPTPATGGYGGGYGWRGGY